jgi:cyclophilin family peptidyl-prolyl cis-trans isomerase
MQKVPRAVATTSVTALCGVRPGAQSLSDITFIPEELGQWPRRRGAVGLSARGRDTGDAQFVVDLVDHPLVAHEHAVFGQVLNGIELIDHILEVDVIDRIEIVSGP